jgi:hypothetical protein
LGPDWGRGLTSALYGRALLSKNDGMGKDLALVAILISVNSLFHVPVLNCVYEVDFLIMKISRQLLKSFLLVE